MLSAGKLFRRVYRMFARVFPRCSMISQAIAFNLFLAFFPTLLIAVALATSRIGGRTSLFDLITDFTQFLPPGSQPIVSQFLVMHGPEAWKIAARGWSGTVLHGDMVVAPLWWLLDVRFGVYVRRVPFSFVYGGLAGVVGLIIWMQLSAVIIFLGAVWNAELAESRKRARAHA